MRYSFFTENAQILEGFSTESAHAVEGDSLIAVGGRVEISYQGVIGNENHPGKAVKIVMIPVE